MMRPFVLLVVAAVLGRPAGLRAAPGAIAQPAPGVYFHEGDGKLGTCNTGWIEMAAYVIAVDANFPSGAQAVIPAVRASTPKPVRYVIDTHFHPDHASGNQVWVEAFGAVPVAQAATLEQLQHTGAAAWRELARTRPDIAASRLCLPQLVYQDAMAFDDGVRRVELQWPGVAHTRGDTLVWLPKERVLFTGDVCVNGPFNYLHDCNLAGWIRALAAAQALRPVTVCPGHGPIGGADLLAGQEAYLVALRGAAQALVDAGVPADLAKARAPALAATLRLAGSYGRWVPTDYWFQFQLEKAYAEVQGGPLADGSGAQ